MNLEKKCTNNLLIDVGNSLIKFGIFANKKWNIKKINTKKSESSDIIKIIKWFDKKFDINKIYVCSVVKKTNLKLEKCFLKLKIAFYFIKQDDFISVLTFASKEVNIHEVGNDILIILYYIKDMHNLIVCNFGSALVTIKKTIEIDGVLIYADLIQAQKAFLSSISLKSSLISFKDFGNSTSQAISGSLFYIIDGYINNILNHSMQCQTFIYSGGNRQIMKLVNMPKYIETIEINEIVLKGMHNFVCTCLKENK